MYSWNYSVVLKKYVSDKRIVPVNCMTKRSYLNW